LGLFSVICWVADMLISRRSGEFVGGSGSGCGNTLMEKQ
jgi:hypothetical protein